VPPVAVDVQRGKAMFHMHSRNVIRVLMLALLATLSLVEFNAAEVQRNYYIALLCLTVSVGIAAFRSKSRLRWCEIAAALLVWVWICFLMRENI
jgi:hypothetical protein